MATAAGDSASYGGGAGGKFRQRPLRRPRTTPYDRPPTAVRNTRRIDDNSSSRGWLSRIVDPASKLITAGAHKFFSSVFHKRFLPSPPPQPSQDGEVEPLENHLGDAMTEAPSRIQEGEMIEGNTHMTEGVAELMDVLKQKTFTRSEIDRLMVLLHSRKVDNTATERQRRCDLTSSEPPASHSRQKDLRGTAFENGFDLSGVSRNDLTPAVRSNVDVGDGTAPNEPAKSYMGSMSTRVSPSTLGPHSQAVREETPAFATRNLHRPSVSTVQKPQSPAGNSQNDFVIPRSRGRSAIYNMARTPYSRVQPIVTKVLGTSNDAFGGQSLSSSQKALKRRSSVLENDTGTTGAIRRIRQKPNLLYNASPSGTGEASSSKAHEDKGEKGPISHVSSKSTEMGQRILQQLEKLTPPREKSNEKKPGFSGGMSGMELTPSMLSGQARKSLETVESLKYVQSGELSGKIVSSWNSVREAQDFTPKGPDNFYDSSSNLLENSSSKIYPENDKARIADNDVMAITEGTTPVVLRSAVDAPKRSPGFQMSAYEDYLDLDDDTHLNGVASSLANEGKSNLSVSSSMMSNGKLPEHPSLVEATKADRHTFPAVETFSNPALKNATTVDASNTAENGISHSITDSVLHKTNGSSIASLDPDKSSVSAKADIPASTIGFGLKSSEKFSPPAFIAFPVVESSINKNVTSSVFSVGVASTDAAIKLPGSNNESMEAVDLVKRSDNAPSSEHGSFFSTASSFGSFPLKSAAVPSPLLLSSQSLSSSTSAQSTFTTSNTGVPATIVGADAVGFATATASSNSVATSVAFPSFQSTFEGSSLASDSSILTAIAGKPNEIAIGNSTSSNLVGAASVPAQASATSSFQFGVRTPGTISQLQASASNNVSIPSTATAASTTERVLSQPTASALPVSSLSSSLPMNSGSLASASDPVTSSSTFGLSSSNIFGSSPQPTNSPVFGSAFNNPSSSSSSSSSSGLVSFGVSAASTPSSGASSSGFAFGTSSISAPANGSAAVAPFGSSSTSTASPSLTFGSSAPAPGSVMSSGFTFGASSISAPANSSFEAPSSTSATSSSTPSVFGLGVSSSASSSAPSSSFSFGLSPTSANSSAKSSTFSFEASTASASASSGVSSSSFAFGASPASASSGVSSSSFAFGASPVSANSSAPSSSFSFGVSSSSAPSSTFSFGASSASAPSTTSSSPFLFGSSSASSTPTTTPVFPFGSAASTPTQPSQPAFGNSSSIFGFGSTPSPSPLGNNDQMSMEDSMVEDSSSMHQSPTLTPVFGQTLPASNFSFGMAQAQAPSPAPAPLGANPFQFGGQQNQVVVPPNPFQASGSFDGGSFSLGAGGNDKSNRRIVKPKGRNRKK